jgi:choice-of-anchor A domain-containing protein
MAVASVTLASGKSYAQDPVSLTVIATYVGDGVGDLKKAYDIYTALKGLFAPDPTTAQLITDAVAALQTFIVDNSLPWYEQQVSDTMIAYAKAAQTQSAADWLAFDEKAYSTKVLILGAIGTQYGLRYAHALAAMYFQIMPRLLAVHLNGAQWNLPLFAIGSSHAGEVYILAHEAIVLAYQMVGGKTRPAAAAPSSPATDNTRTSGLFKFIETTYDNSCWGSDDFCAAYFQTDVIVQAIEIGAAGIYDTFSADPNFPNLDLMTGPLGASRRLDVNASWRDHWQGYSNAVWTPMAYFETVGRAAVPGRVCPHDYGIVGVWNLPYQSWNFGFLCQKWPAAPDWTDTSNYVQVVKNPVVPWSDTLYSLEYHCDAPNDFLAGNADDHGFFVCRHRLDGTNIFPTQGGCADMDVKYGTSMPSTGAFTALPAGTYLAGSVYTSYQDSNSLSYTYCRATFPSGFNSPADAWNQGTVFSPQSNSQHYPEDFSIFALKGVTGIQDVRGPVAAGGDLTASSFRINADSKLPFALVVSGNLSLNYGTIIGQTFYGGNKTIDPSVSLNGQVAKLKPIDFQTALTQLQGMSTALSRFPATGSVSTNYSTITLASTDPNFEVFSLSADALSKATSIQCFFQPNATVVINVSGSGVSLQNMGMSAWKSGTPPKQTTFNWSHIIWNFYEATSLVTSSVTIAGSILAPLADAHLQWGQVSGTLVASSVVTSSEFYWAPFENNLLSVVSTHDGQF